MADFEYDMDGGIVMGSPTLDFDATMSFLLESTWDVEGEIRTSFETGWNIGETPLNWYRIEGECTSAVCETLGVDPADEKCGTGDVDGAKFLTTIAARSLTDLCEKMKDPALFPPIVTKIKSIKKHSRPVNRQEKEIVFDEAEGLVVTSEGPQPNPECNILIPQPIIPCIEEITTSSFDTTVIGAYVQVYSAYEFDMTGGIVMSGEATYTAPSYVFDMEGGIVMSGEAEVPWWHGTIVTEVGGYVAIFDTEVEFVENTENVTSLTISDDVVSLPCGCGDLPLSLILRHNIYKANILTNFIKRNNLTFSDVLTLRYNRNTTSWQAHLHFTGIGNFDQRERWTFVFDFACTDTIGPVELGASVWRLYFFANRENLVTGEDSETRIIFAIPTNFACHNSVLQFKASVDSRDGTVTLERGFSDNEFYNDSIGLFKNKLWEARPNVLFEINQNDITGDLVRYDIKPIFPVSELNLEN